MTTPDPEPKWTPGLEPGGQVSPGETPPAEGGTHGISHPEQPELRKGWAAMPLTVIMIVVALVVIGLIAMAVAL
ncbi:hypothetical protein F7R91_25750 [Streptomyces luteolifulvus]|jgi:hypothetical protein|uniref:Uncharacterized protein n=1 Tax=Streptomyces luteolifulvus TaxID=2615112 RepID=A0A6H9UWM2_9ACTN|nr:DUF6480 family protein [Streptomyces luteolifulvus]KAB1143534.1 hypothetical protein F7R91_25750 [Streptomyces luteolifulvus]